MKIEFVGVGNMSSNLNSTTSILINDEILLDIGSGIVNRLKNMKKNTSKIKYIFITHYHVDHFLDIAHFLIRRGIRKEENNLLTIVGPRDIRKKVLDLLYFTHKDGKENKYDEIEDKYNIKFISVDNNKEVFRGFCVEGISMIHGTANPCVGYLLTMNNKVIGYTGDTTLCEGLEKLIEESDIIIADATTYTTNSAHLGIDKITEFARKHNNKKFYAVHRNDYIEKKDCANLYYPEENSFINID